MGDIDDLYRLHGGTLLAYLRRGFSRCGTPEDMLQETFLHALRHQDRLASAVSQRAWLFGVARHVGLTAARRHRPLDVLDSSAAAVEVRPEIIEMRQAIAALPEISREALELRLREGLSYEEIALMLEIPIGTVRSRLHTAMRQLRATMSEEK